MNVRSREEFRRWLPWIASAVALIAVVSLLLWLIYHRTQTSEVTPAQDHATQRAPSESHSPTSTVQPAVAVAGVQTNSAADSGGSAESGPAETPARPSEMAGSVVGQAGNPASSVDPGAVGGDAPRGTPPDPDAQEAWTLAVAAASRLLKDPAAATFPALGTPGTSAREDGHAYRVEGFVDAPNSLGTLCRVRFTCIVRPTQRGSDWEVTELELSD